MVCHENKERPPLGFHHPTRAYGISPLPHGGDAHAVRPRTRAAARQQHTDNWFVPLVDTAGIYPRDTVTSTALHQRWRNQTGQKSGRASASTIANGARYSV